MWNLRNKTNEQREERVRDKPRNRLLTRENMLMVTSGGGGEWVKWVMGIKEGTWDEHRVLYVSAGSLNSTPETNIILCWNLNKNLGG